MRNWNLWRGVLAASALAVGVVQAWAQPAVGTRVDNGVLAIDSQRSVPLPVQGGSWSVVFSEADSRVQSHAHLLGLVHSDPLAPVPMLMVRPSVRGMAWRGSVCQTSSDSAFMLEYYGTQISGNSQRCSMVFPIRSLVGFRNTTSSQMWAPFFKSGVDIGALPMGGYLLASWRMQEFGGHSLIVEALVRADALGTSSGELLDSFRRNQLNPAHRAMKDWLMQAVVGSANAYFKGQQSALREMPFLEIRQAMQNASPTVREDFAAAPVVGTSVGENTAVAPVSEALGSWRAPVDIDTGVVSMPAGFADGPITAFEVQALEPVKAPANGVLVYRGPLSGASSGFVIDHGQGLLSMLHADSQWNLRMGPQPGERVEQGQFLASAGVAGSPALLQWEVVRSDASLDRQATGDELWRMFRSGSAVSTRVLADIGAVRFVADGSRDLGLAVQGRELPRARTFDVIYLFKAGRVPLQITSGGVFKTVTQDELTLSARGLTTQTIGRKGNSGFGAIAASFTASDLAATEQVMASLGASPMATALAPVATTQPMPSQASAGPSAADLAERERLQAEAAQREQELERLRQQLAQAEAERLAEAQRAQEAQRLADARAADAARLADAQRQAQAARQAEEARQQALAQQQAQQQAQQARQAEEAAQAQRVAALNSGKRKALVIGNDLYRNVPKLDNARSDARAMGQSLESLGFKVTVALDLTERGMKETLRNFKASVQGGDEVVVFYAGHGVQLGASNYLLPVDIAGQDEAQVRDEAIQMQRILDDMQEQRTGFMLMIVDACRDNPFKVAGRSIGGRGLAPTSAATGQMVIFSAGAGQQALDRLGPTDKEPNGLFTRLFLREMQKPGQPVDRVLRSVRSEVARLARSVGHEQTPALYDQSLGDFFLKP